MNTAISSFNTIHFPRKQSTNCSKDYLVTKILDQLNRFLSSISYETGGRTNKLRSNEIPKHNASGKGESIFRSERRPCTLWFFLPKGRFSQKICAVCYKVRKKHVCWSNPRR